MRIFLWPIAAASLAFVVGAWLLPGTAAEVAPAAGSTSTAIYCVNPIKCVAGRNNVTISEEPVHRDVDISSDTPKPTDCWNYIHFTASGGATVTVTAAVLNGTNPNGVCDIAISQYGGPVTFQPGPGVTAATQWTKTGGVYTMAVLHIFATNGAITYSVLGAGAP